MSNDKPVAFKITTEIGILYMGQIINTFKSFCFHNGFDLNIEKGSGILSKPLYITIRCSGKDKSKVVEFLANLEQSLRRGE